ncbi:MAG TPA: zinc ribbon domain-containing protein [Blastocatellia bacterium]|nr:zinc ribbon domain-containing protein [Blastocatellia bacterium]
MRRVQNGLVLRRDCARCHLLSDMVEHRLRKYFTLFFIPIVPVSRGETLLVCGRCQATYYPQSEDYLAFNTGGSSGRVPYDGVRSSKDRIVINCGHCNGRLRIPVEPDRNLQVTCPHCREKFDFKVERD